LLFGRAIVAPDIKVTGESLIEPVMARSQRAVGYPVYCRIASPTFGLCGRRPTRQQLLPCRRNPNLFVLFILPIA
jgi:hypothetical protein